MDLKLEPSTTSHFPIRGFIIRSSSVRDWILELQELGFRLEEITVSPIPGLVPNSVWGCLVRCDRVLSSTDVGRNELCQQVRGNLFISERTILSPKLSEEYFERIFKSSGSYLIHSLLGTIELEEPIRFSDFLEMPIERSVYAIRPEDPTVIPKTITGFHIRPVSKEETLKVLEEKAFPKRESFKDKPLSILEKTRLWLYGALYSKTSEKGKIGPTKQSKLHDLIDGALHKLGRKGSKLLDRIQRDFENLAKRNQKELEKLLTLLDKNPEEALKYAIPLDETGASRGERTTEFNMSRLWTGLSLFGEMRHSSSGSIDLGDGYDTLRSKYFETAEALKAKGEYEKAAFVYLKLLKQPNLAAECLKLGRFYAEAAAIYLKNNMKEDAAKCYEDGNMTLEAVKLYADLNMQEKAGDLYTQIGKRKEALESYDNAALMSRNNNRYLAASQIYLNKMHDLEKAQKTLLEGWGFNREASACLAQFFRNVPNDLELRKEITRIYSEEVTPLNSEVFLRSIIRLVNTNEHNANHIKQIGYQIIADSMVDKPSIVETLKILNPSDAEVHKDITRFRLSKKKT